MDNRESNCKYHGIRWAVNLSGKEVEIALTWASTPRRQRIRIIIETSEWRDNERARTSLDIGLAAERIFSHDQHDWATEYLFAPPGCFAHVHEIHTA